MRSWTNATAVRLALFVALATPLGGHGAYRLFDNFEGKELGPVGGQDGWSAGVQNLVVVDPADALNLALYVPSTSSSVHKSLLADALGVPNGRARMLFFRLRVAEKQTFSVGVSHLTNPEEYGDFGPEIGMANSAPNLDLRVWDDDGGNYEIVAQLTAQTWYNVWVFMDAATDEYQIWMHNRDGEDAKQGDKLAALDSDDTFEFRAGTASDYITFYIRTSGGSSGTNFGPVYFDDIHLDLTDQINLALPGTIAAGDIDADGDVDSIDRELLVDVLLGSDADLGRTTRSDVNGDGLVSSADIQAFVAAWLAA